MDSVVDPREDYGVICWTLAVHRKGHVAAVVIRIKSAVNTALREEDVERVVVASSTIPRVVVLWVVRGPDLCAFPIDIATWHVVHDHLETRRERLHLGDLSIGEIARAVVDFHPPNASPLPRS